MKNIIQKINEVSNNLVELVQQDDDTNAASFTFDVERAKSKYKKGFVVFGESTWVTLTFMNSSKDLDNLFGDEDGSFKEFDSIKVGERRTIKSSDDYEVLRIW